MRLRTNAYGWLYFKSQMASFKWRRFFGKKIWALWMMFSSSSWASWRASSAATCCMIATLKPRNQAGKKNWSLSCGRSFLYFSYYCYIYICILNQWRKCKVRPLPFLFMPGVLKMHPLNKKCCTLAQKMLLRRFCQVCTFLQRLLFILPWMCFLYNDSNV